jgi:hypothetical protein
MESAMLNKTKNVLEIYSKRGIEGKVLNRLYRQLFRPELYEKAYVEIYANLGSTTKGTSEDTLDGMSEERIGKIIQNVKQEQHRWKPVRRTYIPKGNGKSRPLGIPSGDDKLLQAAMKILLEAYYEPTFSKRSHGFRPGKGCHTALTYVGQSLKDTNWFIEGDIKGCFDNIDHDILLGIIGEKNRRWKISQSHQTASKGRLHGELEDNRDIQRDAPGRNHQPIAHEHISGRVRQMGRKGTTPKVQPQSAQARWAKKEPGIRKALSTKEPS